jgi:hypothetical protein
MLPLTDPSGETPAGRTAVRCARRAGLRAARRGRRRRTPGRLLVIMAALAVGQPAYAHGIAGNRFFPGTMTFDDPAVADEFLVNPTFSQHPAGDGTNVRDATVAWSFVRLLTPDLAVGASGGWINRSREAFPDESGFDQTSLTIKKLLYKNEPHETLISASLTWGIGGSGSQRVGANAPDTLQPGIFFGKGFGDLPDSFAWLRPFGIAGAVTADFPTRSTSVNFGVDPVSGQFGPMATGYAETLHWGFAIEYSTYYLTSRFTGGPPKEEPLHQLVPLVEFSFDSPRGQKTAATMNPGFAYVADTWQVSAEVIVPLNSEGGRALGARTQLLLFLDDLIPSVFGKPLLTGKTGK